MVPTKSHTSSTVHEDTVDLSAALGQVCLSALAEVVADGAEQAEAQGNARLGTP